MLLRSTIFAALVALVLSACSSEDSEPTRGDVEAGDGSGGSDGSGGTAAAGGSGTGGAAGPQCDVDYEGNACKTCLADKCCDAAKECLEDETCAAALEVHLECASMPNADNSGCFSAFVRAIHPTPD